jgi:hypothetical protein
MQEVPDQIRQSVETANLEISILHTLHLEIFEAPRETRMSWWKRSSQPPYISHHTIGKSKPANFFSGPENTICPYLAMFYLRLQYPSRLPFHQGPQRKTPNFFVEVLRGLISGSIATDSDTEFYLKIRKHGAQNELETSKTNKTRFCISSTGLGRV